MTRRRLTLVIVTALAAACLFLALRPSMLDRVPDVIYRAQIEGQAHA